MDLKWMEEALVMARMGAAQGEVPVGAVLVYGGRVIARAHNEVEREGCALANAEMLCLKRGSEVLGNWRLLGATLYCTLEPCPMCAGAMIHARLERLVWGAPDLRCGAHGSWVDLLGVSHPIHQLSVTTGVLKEECGEEMRQFFKRRRHGEAIRGACGAAEKKNVGICAPEDSLSNRG